MRKSSLLVLVAGLVGLVGLAIAEVRVSHTAPRKKSAAPASSASVPRVSSVDGDAGSQARAQEIIRFASNAKPAPPFLVNDLDGNFISTAGWRGKVVLLNFWATWCPPCRDEIPEFIDLANRYKDGLIIVGVSMDDAPPSEVKKFASDAGINYPIVMASREMVREYGGVPALPTAFVVDPEGRVVQKHVGLFPSYVYETEVRALLKLPVDATIQTFEDTGQIFLKNAALATELPGVDFSGLTPEQKKIALKRMNTEGCDCGCKLTLAQCRINDTSCPVSKKLTAKVVQEVSADTKPAPASAPTSNQ
jgi:thiol-disulfide isomerase/thioredoxin